MSDDRRLIEDYLPIEAISAEASREKSVRKGHISTLHLWWPRRPLGDTYWLYVVWNPLGSDPRLVKIQNPFRVLEYAAKARDVIRRYEIPAQAIEAAARSQRGAP